MITPAKRTTDWHKIAREEVPKVLASFYHPLVDTTLFLEEKLKKSDTAYFDFTNNQTHVAIPFLEELVSIGKISPQSAVQGIYKHELGHYYHYPKECSKLMFLGHLAEIYYPKYGQEILAYWVDMLNNLPQMVKKHHGQELRELYCGMNIILEERLSFSAEQRKELQALDINPKELRTILRTYSVDRLITACYQKLSREDLGVNIDGEYLADKLEKVVENDGQPLIRDGKPATHGLATIDYLNPQQEIGAFVLFGDIIQEVLRKRDELLEPYRKKLPKIPSGFPASHSPSLDDFTDKQIEEGLDIIIRQWGKKRYEKIKGYVDRQRGRPKPKKAKPSRRLAGLERSKLQFNDDQIAYYEKKSAAYGIYIYRKPILADAHDQEPEGTKEFQVGDPLHLLDPFSSFGHIFPGITQRSVLRPGHKQDHQYRTPNCMLWIDSSGSMVHPVESSDAVTGGFVFARNYWKNDALVGVINLSVDMALLPPGRDLRQVYSMLCAFWNGGTHFNIKRIKQYMHRLAHEGLPQRIYTTEKECLEFVQRLSEAQQRQFMDKHVEVRLDKKVREYYEKMDNILITDGGIYNLPEVVEYMNSTAEITRNVILLINSPATYEEWKKLSLPRTQIIPVDKSSDLIGISIGRVKRIAPPDSRPVSIFRK